MAEIVGGVAVPHTPHFPVIAEQDDEPGRELRRLYGEVAKRVEAMRPDVIVLFTSDHYNNFFVESIPIFSIGVAESAEGPKDYAQLEHCEIAVEAPLANAIQSDVVAAGFDVGMTQEFVADHPITIALQFTTPKLDVPIVPVWISAFMRPIPSAQRCYDLGAAIADAVKAWPADKRVMALATGSFSLEIGGPRMSADSHTGVPAPEWVDRIMELLDEAKWDRLLGEATDQQLDDAGSAGGELLMWLAMLGMLKDGPPSRPLFLEAQREWGHAYGAWSLDGGGR